MKKTAVIFLIILTVLLSAGCSGEHLGKNNRVVKHQYIFKGENELWYAEYCVNGEGRFTEKDGRIGYESWNDKKLTVVYKNDISELSDVRDLEISYQAGSSSGSLILNQIEDGPMDKFYRLGSGSNGSVIGKDETVAVTVTLDRESQTIELKNSTSTLDRINFLLHKSVIDEHREWKALTGL